MNTFSFRVLLVLFTFFLIVQCSPKITDTVTTSEIKPMPPKAMEEGNMPIPRDSRVVTGQLENGMNYYIQKNQKPENRAELRLALNAGSILEDEDQLGLAHFVEHMAFNGTENFKKSELVDYLESVGTRFGPDLNAYTSFDETVYMLQVRTDSAELFDKGMLIIKDWANGISFENEEIDKERGVVESEWRSRLSPDQRMQKKTFPVLFHGSMYAKRLPIGSPDIIKNADYEVVKRFYRDWYRPDLMAVVVVGDVNVAEVENQIKTLFGSIPAVQDARERTKFDVPRHDETLVTVASDKEASFTRIQLMYKHDKVHIKNLKDYRQNVVNALYNRMLGVRFDELRQSAEPPFIFANSGYGSSVGDMDTYSSFAIVPEGKTIYGLNAILTENKRVLLHGFTSGELVRAKKQALEGADKNFKEMDKTESGRLAMRYVYNYLDNNPIPGPDQTLRLYKKYLPTITLNDVNSLAKKWIRDQSRVVIVTGPEKEEAPLPSEAEIQALIDKVSRAKVDAYVDDAIDAPFFDKELSPVAITKEETYDDVDVKYMKLANGVEVYLKKTDFKNDEIMVSAFSPGGTSLYDDKQYQNAQNAAQIVSEAGIGLFSNVQLEKLLAGKSVGINPFIGEYSEGFNGTSSPDDLEILFQMVYKYFYEPRNDIQAYTSYTTRMKGLYKNLMSNPQYFFSDHVSKIKYDNNSRMRWPKDEDWNSMDYNSAMDIYEDRFADASDFTFSFVGNFDEEKIKSYIQKYLGNLPNTGREEEWKDLGIRAVKGGVNNRIKFGEAPKTNVHMYYHGDFDYNSENKYILSSAIAYLRIKLREELREDKGGVYGVGVRGGGSKKPIDRYGITVSFNADPPKANELIKAAKDVIKKATMDGPNAVDMTKVKETQRQSRIKNLKENRFWQRQINLKHEEKMSFEGILIKDYEKKVANLTSAQIKAAIKEYFSKDNYMEIVMEPAPSNTP
ncbi:MAG: insulinase family protein [Saprospiraceae bacterium]